MTGPDGTVSARTPRFLDRLKPRASSRTQSALAAVAWTLAAVILGARGAIWLAGAPAVLLVLAPVFGLLKSRLLLDGVARRALERIEERGRDRCAGGFLSWRSWLLVLSMVAVGHALRLTSTPREWLGALYVAIAIGLLLSSRLYWMATLRREE